MSFESEEYGRYLIRSGPLQGRWAANAFRGKLSIAKAVGDSRDVAVSAVKAELDSLDEVDRAGRNSEGAPAADVYKRAFMTVLPLVSDGYRAMLRAHLAAPDHLLSATKLAAAAGYSGYEGANLHYGKLGYLIASEIGFDPPRRKDGTPIWTAAIAREPGADLDFPDTSLLDAVVRTIDLAHFEWQMRPEVVAALRALGF